MKKIIALPLSIIIILTGMFSSVRAAPQNQPKLLEDTISGVTATVKYETWLEGSYSTMDVTLSNIPNGAGIANGIYTGWCIQDGISGELRGQQATLYNSLSSTLPSDIAALPWNKINYVLNHKIRGAGKTDLQYAKDVQSALWVLTGATDPEFGISTEAQMMIDNANNNPEYTPSEGDLFAVVIYSDGFSQTRQDRIQEAIIEVRLTASPTPTTTATITSSGTVVSPTNTSTGTINTPTNTPTTTPTGTVNTPTNTPTITTTPPSATATLPNTCVPLLVIADLSNIPPGASIEGMGVVAPNLNIDAKGTAVKISEGSSPIAYGAPNIASPTLNGGLNPAGGFSDVTTKSAQQAHQYTFTFAPGTAINRFSLRMLDFGDLNPSNNPFHYASMIAYDAANNIVSKSELGFISDASYNSPQYGYLGLSGDAKTALPGQPGNWMWFASGTGITKVILTFGDGYDPNIAFDTLSYSIECQVCSVPLVTTNLASLATGQSIEGMGVVAPNLNIDAKGTAVKISESTSPIAYGAPNIPNPTLNGGLNPAGGFSDMTTKLAQQAHQYTFTFAPGTAINRFSLHMLDFGDLNPTNNPYHYASMTAYDAANNIVSKSELSFISDANYNSPQYGYLGNSGDAITALPGQPGNWMWFASGTGITKVILTFGDGYDPNIAFDTMVFCPDAP